MRITPLKIKELKDEQYQRIMQRSMLDISSIYEYVREIVEDVRKEKNRAILRALKKELNEDISAEDLKVKDEEIKNAYKEVDKSLIDALKSASKNIRKFHEKQLEKEMWACEIMEGVIAGRIIKPIERVGCYVPGGTAIYPSTILMTVIPAKVAKVSEIIVVSPPRKAMKLNPLVLVAADIAGADAIFKVGGPWAIAALSFGTETIPKVDKIVGPGNKYVTAAKMIVYGKVDIDSPAGPSEVLIIADESADPEWIAIDFLSQIEHDPDSSAILISTSHKVSYKVCDFIEKRYKEFSRKEILESSLSKYSFVLMAEDMDEAIEFANEYAPEHLQIVTKEPFSVLQKIKNAGSIFLGHYSPVAAGDYASGTNHVLPTGRGAKMFSGLSVDDFIKKPTFQYITKDGLYKLKDTIIRLAKEEGLFIHAESIKERFKN